MQQLTYLSGYPEQLTDPVKQLIADQRLGKVLLKRYPLAHEIKTDKALYDYTVDLKHQFLRKANALSKVVFDPKIDVIHQALGLHTFISRVQGNKLKAKHEIRIGVVFKTAPLQFLRMIVVHELAHLKEKQHNKAFYKLCTHMEPDYHQLEFDLRLYLTQLELFGKLYP
ncbi:MAG: M48 family metallopeptidase [Desulfuromonas sp.]|nr:M48 family metallopeptidase [Desulfuromonas sp.]